MQSVSRSPSGIATVSIASPSESRKRNFSVPSLDFCRAATSSRGSEKRSASRARNAFGRSVMSSKRATGLVHR